MRTLTIKLSSDSSPNTGNFQIFEILSGTTSNQIQTAILNDGTNTLLQPSSPNYYFSYENLYVHGVKIEVQDDATAITLKSNTDNCTNFITSTIINECLLHYNLAVWNSESFSSQGLSVGANEDCEAFKAIMGTPGDPISGPNPDFGIPVVMYDARIPGSGIDNTEFFECRSQVGSNFNGIYLLKPQPAPGIKILSSETEIQEIGSTPINLSTVVGGTCNPFIDSVAPINAGNDPTPQIFYTYASNGDVLRLTVSFRQEGSFLLADSMDVSTIDSCNPGPGL